MEMSFLQNYDNSLGLNALPHLLPLWDLNGRSLYSQFQLFASLKPEDDSLKNDNSVINYEEYKCTLCNTNVPTMYRKEHNNSPKHRTSVEIVIAVLERVTANVSIVNDDMCIDKTSNTHFCDACVVVMKNGERNRHESSESHHKAVLRNRLLSDLQKIYKNRDYLDTVDFKYLTESYKNDITGLKAESLVLKEEENEKSTVKCEFPSSLDQTVLSNGNLSSTEGLKSTQHTPVAKDMLPNSPSIVKSLSSISNNSVAAATKTTKTEKKYCGTCDLYIDYHNYNDHLTSKKHAKKALLLRNNSIETKSLTTKTKDHTSQTETRMNKNSVHAVTSKALTTETDVCHHITTKEDNKLDNKSNTEAKCNTATPREAVNINNAVKAEFNTAENKDTFKTEFSKAETKSNTTETKDSNTVTKPTTETPHYHFQSLDYILVYCRVCESKVPNHIKNMSEHLNGGRHKIAYNDLLANNKITESANNQLFCKGCEVIIEFQKELNHIVSSKHQSLNQSNITAQTKSHTNETKYNTADSKCNTFETKCTTAETKYETAETKCTTAETKYETAETKCTTAETKYETAETKCTTAETKYETAETKCTTAETKCETAETKCNTAETLHYHLKLKENNVYCLVCQTGVPNNEGNIKDHLIGGRHSKTYNKMLLDNKIKQLQNKQFICEVCKKYMGPKKVLDHIMSPQHKSKTAEFKSDTAKAEINTEVEPDTTNTLHSHLKLIDNNLTCLVCKTTIPDCVKNINEHLKGGRHSTTFANLLQDNKMEQLEDGRCYCEVCKKNIVPQKELSHIASAKHRKRLPVVEEEITEYVCTLCNVAVPNSPYYIKMHKETTEHNYNVSVDAKVNNTFHHHFETYDDELLLCKVCKHLMYDFEYGDHLKSDVHIANYTKILHENQLIKQTSQGLKCKPCKKFILSEDDLTHIETEKHKVMSWISTTEDKDSFNLVQYYCGLCEVEFPSTAQNIKRHEAGAMHKAKLEEIHTAKETIISTAIAETDLIVPTGNPNEMECNLCKVRMHFSNVTEHLVGAKHRKQAKFPPLSLTAAVRENNI